MSVHLKSLKNRLQPFRAPDWFSMIQTNIPQEIIKLAQTPSPIHAWKFDEVPKGFNLSIKRDDLTGNITAGNKIRKLEFILADAIRKDSTSVITCGGVQSNHCRITAAAAKSLNLGCHLVLRSHQQKDDAKSLLGNQLLNRLNGAQCYMVPYVKLSGLNARLEMLQKRLRELGENPFVIPLGGSYHIGTFGILNLFQELIEQDVLSRFDDIVLATGSGGTLAGLAIGNYLTGGKLRVHGVAVCDDAESFYKHVDETLQQYGLCDTNARNICDVIEGYKGQGYSKTTTEELDLLVKISQETGVLLDYCYTFKCVRGILGEMRNNPGRFKGNRVLFIHTGGTFSIFDGVVTNSPALCKQPSKVWNDIEDIPV